MQVLSQPSIRLSLCCCVICFMLHNLLISTKPRSVLASISACLSASVCSISTLVLASLLASLHVAVPVFPFFVPVLLKHVYCDFSGSHPLLSPSLCLPRGFSCCCAACSSAVIVLRALQLLLCCLLFCQGDDWPVTHYWLDVQCSYRPC